MIDENRFFREVSIRICSSLDIEKALARCFSFLKDVMPIDELMLVVYERETWGPLRSKPSSIQRARGAAPSRHPCPPA